MALRPDMPEYADNDLLLQAQYKLSGLCRHCGKDPNNTSGRGKKTFSRHHGLCMECFFYQKTH